MRPVANYGLPRHLRITVGLPEQNDRLLQALHQLRQTRRRPVTQEISQQFHVQPSSRVEGVIRVPGDKSVSHRALMLGAIATGTSHVTGFLPGEDCLATMAALRSLGIEIRQHDATTIDVAGQGMHGLAPPSRGLDMGNSGTAMRLFMGLLAAQSFPDRADRRRVPEQAADGARGTTASRRWAQTSRHATGRRR